ncbi:lipocalin-like domain-containing protein [Paraburkholderia sp. 40]|uniref:lipocalin-like domain-containing protein n=1 Tax=unclassified Paraburkholderia TaxID=2615204 RepID=UPI003D1A5D7B
MVDGAVAALIAVAAASGAARAQESPLSGAWRLVSYKVESKVTGGKIAAMGEHPSGRVIFTADHPVAFMLTRDGRKPGKGDAEKAALLNTLVAYTGIERAEDNQWCTKVEAAWNSE